MNATVKSDMWLGDPTEGGAGGYGFGDGSGTGDTKVKIGTLGLTWTLSPSVVLDGSLRLRPASTRPAQPARLRHELRHGRLRDPGHERRGRRRRRHPLLGHARVLQLSGFAAFGGVDGWTPLFRNDRSYNFSANLTYS